MPKRIAIIGGGLTGLMCAYVLAKSGTISIRIIDAAPKPEKSSETFLRGHVGATLGHGCDARHVTGTEGLSLQNPVHTKLLFEKSLSGGWQAIDEADLTEREKQWRKECVKRYDAVADKSDQYDDMYTLLNYAGMELWNLLCSTDQKLKEFVVSSPHIYVAFQTKDELQKDLKSETGFNRLNDKVSIVGSDVLGAHISSVIPELLRVPGSSWKIQSVWKYLYDSLSKMPSISFEWEKIVENDLPEADAYVWAIGSTHNVPEIYKEKSRVQGLGGVWLRIKNPGFKESFKISAPHPSGYINFTPDGGFLNISGGFGWVGERNFSEAEKLLKPVEDKLIEHLSMFLNIRADELRKDVTGFCIRPATPTCLPDLQKFSSEGKTHIMISGAGKAGATQAPLIALYTTKSLGVPIKLSFSHLVANALDLMEKGFED